MSDESFDAVEAVLCNDIEKIKELILDENIDVSNAIKLKSPIHTKIISRNNAG